MRRVEHHGVHVLGHERRDAFHRIGRDADACGHTQTALRILAGVGMILYLGDVLIGDEPHQTAFVVHDGEFFDLVVQQHLRSMLQRGVVRGDKAVAGGHHLGDLARHVALETQVAVGDDADQLPRAVHDGNAADAVLLHQIQGVAHGVLLRDGHRVVDHAVLSAFHAADLRGLLGDRHVLVDHSDTAFASQCDGQRCFGHGIHRGRHDGNVEPDISRETGADIDLSRQHFRIGGYEQHIVERKSFGLNPFIDKRHNERGFLLLAKLSIFFETAQKPAADRRFFINNLSIRKRRTGLFSLSLRSTKTPAAR